MSIDQIEGLSDDFASLLQDKKLSLDTKIISYEDSDGISRALTCQDLVFFVKSKKLSDLGVGTSYHSAAKMNALFRNAKKNLGRFIFIYIEEFRQRLCSSESKDKSNSAIIGGVAAWLALHFNLNSEVANGLAVASVVFLLEVTMGAFCRMSDAEVEETIVKKINFKNPKAYRKKRIESIHKYSTIHF